MKKCFLYCSVGFLCILASCASSKNAYYNPAHKFSPAAMQADVHLLQDILQKKHPSLYWYTPKDSMDGLFRSTIASFTDSLTELQFRNRVSWLIAHIQCGHTQVRFSKQYTRFYTGKRLPQFPLALKAWKDSLVVVTNYLKDSTLRRGTIITSINGIDNRHLLDSMYALIGADANSTVFKEQLISFYFTSFYKSAFGVDSSFRIGYIDSLGNRRSTTIPNFKPTSDSLEKARLARLPKLPRSMRKKMQLLSQRSLEIDTLQQTAFLDVNTFSNAKLRPFFRKTFRALRKQNIKNLVIDVRQNSGGNIFSSTRLLQYVSNNSFRVADTVAAIDRSCKYHDHIKPWFIYWLSLHFTGRKQPDGRIHFRYFEKHRFKPMKRNHFDGSVFVLTGGYTFSAGSMFARQLKGQQNVTLVGEETGGSAYGNTAVHLPEITLPNTGLRVVLPLYRMVFDSDQPKNGRGVLPDVEVGPSSMAIKQGIDIKMEKVKELILQKNQAQLK